MERGTDGDDRKLMEVVGTVLAFGAILWYGGMGAWSAMTESSASLAEKVAYCGAKNKMGLA